MAGFEVRGGARLERTMRAAGHDLQDLTPADTTAGRIVAEAAKDRAPVLTGRLRRSIRADGTRDGATISANVRWAAVQEYGSPRKHITARGYLRGGLTAATPAVVDIYADTVNTSLQQVKGI